MIYHMVKTNQYSFMIMDIIIYKSTNTLSWKLENCLLFWSIGYNFIVKHSNSEKIMRHLTKIVFLLQAALYVCLWWVLFNAHISACLKPLVSWSRKLFLISLMLWGGRQIQTSLFPSNKDLEMKFFCT